MRGLLLAAAVLSAGCASAPAKVKSNGIKHAVLDISSSDELKDNPVLSSFAQSVCAEMFQLNDKNSVCAADFKAIVDVQRDRAQLGAEDPGALEAVRDQLDAPRSIAMSAARAGQKIQVLATLQARDNKVLDKFTVELAPNGEDVGAKAHELAVKVLSVP